MRLATWCLAAVVMLGGASAALACKQTYPVTKSGTVRFEYVICALAGQSVELMTEVRKEFRRQSVDAKGVRCTSVSLGNRFGSKIGKIRVPPFNCEVGGKYLLINGDVVTYDSDARPAPRPSDTDYLVISNPRWSWH